jgi:hypothetical protein
LTQPLGLGTRGDSPWKAGEQRLRGPGRRERRDAVTLDPAGQLAVGARPCGSLLRILDSGARTDEHQARDAFGQRKGRHERQTPTHGVPAEDELRVRQRAQVRDARVEGGGATVREGAMTRKIGREDARSAAEGPAHGIPAGAGLREAVQQDDRRRGARG